MLLNFGWKCGKCYLILAGNTAILAHDVHVHFPAFRFQDDSDSGTWQGLCTGKANTPADTTFASTKKQFTGYGGHRPKSRVNLSIFRN